MKKEIILTLRDKNIFAKKNKIFVNLPNFYYKNTNIFYFNERWISYKKLLSDFIYLDKLYEKNLKILSKILNNYHKENYSTRYWRIIIGKWLYKIICCSYERYTSIMDLQKKYTKIKFLISKYNYKDFIPNGIEDFNYLIGTHSWNEYIYSEIFNNCEIKNIEIIKNNKNINTSEFKETYKRLTVKRHSLKGKLYSKFLSFLSGFNKNKKYLIFDTYLDKHDEINLNYQLNKVPIIFKPPKYDNILLTISKQNKCSNIRNISVSKKFKKFEQFVSKLIIKNIPKTYLEYFFEINELTKQSKLPKNPGVIFTTRGINRNTIMDFYIASKTNEGSKLLIAQHGGNYGQHKGHWGSKHEIEISDKFLSWENIKTDKIIPLGFIKKINKINYNKKNQMILFESRNRLLYSHEFKVDQGAINSKLYFDKIGAFLSLIKKKKIYNNFFIKNNSKNFGWNERDFFYKKNKKINFLNPKLKTFDLINKAKILIYSFPSTGHLECISANAPMLMFYFNDLSLMNNETKYFFKKFIKFGILHTKPETLYKKLEQIYDDPYSWWSSNEIQSLIKNYSLRYCRQNNNLIEDLIKIVK